MQISPILSLLKDKKLIVALNSEPYIHHKTHRGIQVRRGSGGAQHLMDYIMRKTGGTMVAVASGNADQEVVGAHNKIQVPPSQSAYSLKRIFLSKELYNDYYNGFANQTLWPLCHLAFVKPMFEKRWFEAYKKVNNLFAESILEEVGDDDAFIWVNDYQLALLPQILREKNKKISIGTFWHIPWPIKELFSICPWGREIVEGLIASDFIGFHRKTYVENFIETATSLLKIDILPNGNSMYYKKHRTNLDALPAGIDYHEIHKTVDQKESDDELIKKDLDIDFQKLIIGVDRIDYTKGLIERLIIIDSFFQTHPEFIGKVVHLLIGAPSRQFIPTYKELTLQLIKMIDHLNWKYSEGSWYPIYFLHEAVDPHKVYQYYHAADVCMVTSLDDGMNLVAKEYPICAQDQKGVLLLSKYTGASQELTSSLPINPFDVPDSVNKLYKALTMPQAEKMKRNNEMRKMLQNNDINTWAKRFIEKTLG